MSNKIRFFRFALVAFASTCFSQATLTTDFAKAQQFFGGSATSPVKAIAVFSNKFDMKYIDFSQNPLTIKTIMTVGDTTSYRSINISPDGKFVAHSAGKSKSTFIYPVEANTTKKIEIKSANFPNWWTHPVSKKLYLIYRASGTSDIYMQEMDMAGFKVVGTPTKLLSAITVGSGTASANAGRTADGRFMAGDDGLHGMVELENPTAIENAKVKSFVYFSSYLGWQSNGSHLKDQRYAAWCNANVSPAKSSSSQYFDCAQHMGSAHTDIYIRKWPADLNNVGALASNNDCKAKGIHNPPTSVCAPGDVLISIPGSVITGYTHFHGSFWSTHENYIVAKYGKSQNDGSWAGCIFDVSKRTVNNKYLSFLSKNLNKGNDFIHLWVDSDNAVSTILPAKALAGNQDLSVSRNSSGGLTIKYDHTGPFLTKIMDIHGKTLFSGENVRSVKASELPSSIKGTYILVVKNQQVSVIQKFSTF